MNSVMEVEEKNSIIAVEKKPLKMHNNLLLDVIKRQAGSLHKAILEGIMNSIEALASKVEMTFDPEKNIFTINDDGIGISSIEEIEKYFETFGTPHDESENKIWAQFRAGRGQMFSFGSNTWLTSQFKMIVDVKNWGLDYQLEQNHEPYDGCLITMELYENPIKMWQYGSERALKDKIKKQIEFVEIPIFFNGEQLNTPPSSLKWDIEDKNAYYSFGGGMELSIYNMGAFTKELSASSVGNVGVVVSKKQLKVNFARNDIQSDCPVFQEIQDVLMENRVKKTRKSSKRLKIYERQALLNDLSNRKQKYEDIKNVKIIPTSQGKYLSLNDIRKNRQFWVFSPDGDRMADTAMEQGIALCISDRILNELNYTGKKSEFFNWLLNIDNNYNCGLKQEWDKVEQMYLAFDNKDGKKSLSDKFNREFVIIPQNKLTRVEKRFIRVIEKYNCCDGRKICIGSSGVASAWTDGKDYIAIERKFLKVNLSNFREICFILSHELAHDENTEETHIHGPEYYENFYHVIKKYNNPYTYLKYFSNDMKNAIRAERTQEIIKKEQQAKSMRNKKLGIKEEVGEKKEKEEDSVPF